MQTGLDNLEETGFDIAVSFNGRTTGSDPVNVGSSPAAAAKGCGLVKKKKKKQMVGEYATYKEARAAAREQANSDIHKRHWGVRVYQRHDGSFSISESQIRNTTWKLICAVDCGGKITQYAPI